MTYKSVKLDVLGRQNKIWTFGNPFQNNSYEPSQHLTVTNAENFYISFGTLFRIFRKPNQELLYQITFWCGLQKSHVLLGFTHKTGPTRTLNKDLCVIVTTSLTMVSVENQKGAITIQICSVENQKGAISIQICSVENQKDTIAIEFIQR